MSIIKEKIISTGQDLNFKINLSSNNYLNGHQDSIDEFITEETGLSVNDVSDGEKTRFTIDGNSIVFEFKFYDGNTFTSTNGLTSAGFSLNETNDKDEVVLRSFFVIQIYDTNNIKKQELLHNGYYNGFQFSPTGGVEDTLYTIFIDDEFSDFYILNTFTGTSIYMKASFYNAKTGKLHLFLNEVNEGLTTESKLYSDITLLHNINKWVGISGSIVFKEIIATDYVDKVNNTLDSFNNEKPTYPAGTIFTSGGTYQEL